MSKSEVPSKFCLLIILSCCVGAKRVLVRAFAGDEARPFGRMDPPILHGVDNHFQLLRYEPSHILRYKPHACLCIELPHLTRRLLVTPATQTNIKADSFSLCVPRLGKSLTGLKRGFVSTTEPRPR